MEDTRNLESEHFLNFWNAERRDHITRLYNFCENKDTNFMKATKEIIDRIAAADQARLEEMLSPITQDAGN